MSGPFRLLFFRRTPGDLRFTDVPYLGIEPPKRDLLFNALVRPALLALPAADRPMRVHAIDRNGHVVGEAGVEEVL